MDGKNSTGRKVSLLIDSCPAQVQYARVNHSRASSSASTPSLAPLTPPLVRSESTDSRAVTTPSPVTPHFSSFYHHHHNTIIKHEQPAPSLYVYRPRMEEQGQSMYPPIPDNAGVMPYPMTAPSAPPPQQQQQQPLFRASDSPTSEPSLVSAAPSNKAPQKKNQYPCPLAKVHRCNDFFTTSGHAARHSKKHTGKKDAFCPECNKAFTRKDNMEQHRRTHQNVRGPAKVVGDGRVKKSGSKQSSRKSDKQLSVPLEAAVAQIENHQQQQHEQQQQQHKQPQQPIAPQAIMPGGSGPYFLNSDPVQALPQPMPIEYSGRPALYRANFSNPLDFAPAIAPMIQDPTDINHYIYPSPGLSSGLNTLAMAASDHRRMSEEESS